MKLRPFELTLIIIFGLMGMLAIALLSTYKPSSETPTISLGGPVVIWGMVEERAFTQTLQPLIEVDPIYRNIQYVQKDSQSFDSELLNALAESRGPDILFLPHEQLVQYRSKIQPLSYETFPLPDFRSRYIDGAEIFAMNDGVYAFPVAVDPLVMYWNRDLLSTYGYISAPATWEAVVNDIVPTLIVRDFSRTIVRSPLAFGEYSNVQNAFGVLSTLLLQGGSNLVSETNTSYQLRLNQTGDSNAKPLESALTFYTNFANPSNPLYSWNRSKNTDRSEFISEDLVLYFGKGSEARSIAAQNPNLNFDMAEVPQGASATVRRTYGVFYGLAMLRSAPNKNGAYLTMQELGSDAMSASISQILGMAPVYRSTLQTGSNDKYGRIIYSSAIVARGWLNPSPGQVNSIWTQMVEDVLSNRRRAAEAANDAVGRLQRVY